MASLSQQDIREYVEEHIPNFHKAKLSNLKKLKLQKVLARKNPYLLKAKGLEPVFTGRNHAR